LQAPAKFAFTLVELLIGLLLLAIIGSTLTLKVVDAYRVEQTRGLEKQVRSLFTMARHYGTINGDGADLIFRKDEQGRWIGYIVVFNKDYHMQDSGFTKSLSILGNVRSISINNQSISTARFRFFEWTGLFEITLNGHLQNTTQENIIVTYTTFSDKTYTLELPWKEYSCITNKFSPLSDDFYMQ
jgi:type II secretory pathway pseudopilin PulG